MSSIPIQYFNEDISFELPLSSKVSEWILFAINNENQTLKFLNFIFTSDQYLLQINNFYLNHDYFTDIITFNNSNVEKYIEGDIFISINRVLENSILFNFPFLDELHRVLIHGVLHLIGFSDNNLYEKGIMRDKENYYLNLRNF